MVLMVARPALAQDKGAANVSFGYSNLTMFNDIANETINAGWTASVGAGVANKTAIVGEIGGHYDSGFKFHTFQAGVRMSAKGSPTATPFFQVLTGLGHDNTGIAANSWTLQPGGGVDVKINDKAAFRGQVDWMLIRNSGVNTNSLGFGGSIVINLPKK